LIFYLMGPNSFDVKHLPWTIGSMIYYSVVTFTTLGFGDIVPKTPGAAWLVMVEVILGYIMLGGLISILATKLARRS
jgi:voltage-gated potassium channel Kch